MKTLSGQRVHTTIESALGDLTVVAEADQLTGLYFAEHRRAPSIDTLGDRDDAGFEEVRRQLGEYFAGERREFDLFVAPAGDAFQQRVWRLLTRIPYGQTRSYGDLAEQLGDPALAQAVGAANGRNPMSVIVPCHRVVGADGSLVGYAGGLERKRHLLALEEPAQVKADRLF
jgi:methylated-DNA-[protein]-cysteine S-methyltransferase